MAKIKTSSEWLCLEETSGQYLGNIEATIFTNIKANAYNFSWMGMFRHLYLYSLNKEFPEKKFKWKHFVCLKGNFNIKDIGIKR